MSHLPARVCVVGSTNIDLTFRAARLPRLGETIAGYGFHQGFGGKGANQAVAAARLGATVTMVGRVGRDAFGEQALQNLRAHGIDTQFVQVDDTRPTGIAAILVDDAAQNCIVVVPGANLGLAPANVRAAADTLRSVDVVVCQLEIPLETVTEAFRIARAAGVRTILNPAPARELPEELLRLTDVCVPNETELEQIAGQHLPTHDEVEAAARALARRGPQTVLVTLGAQGALLVGETAEQLSPPSVEALDPTGAGDVFIGSLAVFMVEGLPLREAVCRANVAAALSVTRLGTQAAMPRRAEIEAFHKATTGLQ